MRLTTIGRAVTASAALVIAVACGDGTGPNGPPAELTSLPRALTNEEKGIIGANNAFTLALFQKASAAEPGENVFMSPLSASLALGMTMNGARNTTLDAMRTALQYGSLSQADINAGYKSLMSLIMGLDPTVEARIANSIWYRNTLPINPAFVAAAEDYFAAEVSALDFSKPDAAKGTVNGWVSEQTAGRIPTILEEIRPNEVMFLINAIYFKGSWRQGFGRSATQSAPFTSGDGVIQTVPMMFLDGKLLRGGQWADGTKVAELPYGNSAFTMQVYLPPDTSSVESFINRFTAETTLLAGMIPVPELKLWMPRVKLEYKRTLNDDLATLGMGIAFTDNADFGGMVTTPTGLSISQVLQKTFLSIDEEGTEAAAVTQVTIRETSAPSSMSMRCDRPYVVLIRERLSGTILFIGKINSI